MRTDRGPSVMDEKKSDIRQQNALRRVTGNPGVEEALTALGSSELRISRRTREFMALILLVGILVVAGAFWSGRTGIGLTPTLPVASPDVRAGDSNIESTPAVRYATRGEWIEASGLWSRFGILAAAYDGEKIVMSSAESAFGSLGCRISPYGQPMSGACYEVGKASVSKLPAERSCLWEVVILEISPTSIRGKRQLRREESDPGCAVDYRSAPSPFTLERPHGQPTLAIK
jgi:hypothetical protein